MPIYEYLCEFCGYKFEKSQRMSEEPLKECPHCGKEVKRLISAGVGVIFKGKGFYATDYKYNSSSDRTCCGRAERCDKPPCSDDGVCKR
ncbi:MAG: zinc ribbon domain-containing protein [Candidatus Omnitrophica bacterium]|nr:zinc ribbon domain-containing protein [Candidatus Omnitrophota bacterium]